MHNCISTRWFKWYPLILSLFTLCLLLSSCATGKSSELSGVVNVWHGRPEGEAAVLAQVLARFTDIHPDVTIRATAIEPGQLRDRFEQSAASGLGPDLLLGPSSWIMPLADAGLIQSIDSLLPPDVWERYLPSSVETVRYQNSLYGVPESLRLSALYYHIRQVEKSPTTLDALIEEANQGRRVGMSPAFKDAFWGIQAFGGQLFDEDERVVLDDGGLSNWLAWLKTTLDIPNIVLDKNPQTLITLFTEGKLTYLIAGSWEREALEGTVGEGDLGVAPLPSGPIDAAGPFLETDAFMMSVASSPRQLQLAAELAKFVTNAEQQTLLMRQAGSIPTNMRVRNNQSIDPVAFAFRTQARDAVPFLNTEKMESVLKLGDDAFNRTLQGVGDPIVVAQELANDINIANGFETKEIVMDKCVEAGEITIWLGKDLPESHVLEEIGQNFIQACPLVEIEFSEFPEEVYLKRLLDTGLEAQPDLMLIPNQWVVPLTLSSVIQPLNGSVNTQQLQGYHPGGVETFRLNGQLFGIPFVLMPQALYANTSLAPDTVHNLVDFITQGQKGIIAGLPISFVDGYWGVTTHGGKLFAEDGRVILDQGGMREWLDWLVDAQANGGLIVDVDIASLRARFAAGEVAYLVDRPQALADLEEALGDKLLITRLPAGSVSEAIPFLLTSGISLRAGISVEKAQTALAFAAYATNPESQALVVDAARLLPSTIGITIEANDPLAVFAEQAGASTIYPDRAQMITVAALGENFYEQLLTNEQDDISEVQSTETIVQTVVAEINVENGFEPMPDLEGDKSEN